ncbi:hypothetical protein MKX08_005673 [Trichoderma sp. CBMAI-0020]|nr:hypothetical protein MKX08_005673 [Trichoderma sp. CBMAI-0020]
MSTLPTSRGSSPDAEKDTRSSPRCRSKRSSQNATPAWNLMFQPRSYEEIYSERAYLTASLQRHSLTAIELIHQYSLIEEELDAKEHIGKQRRKLRKRMSFIKVKLAEAARQEKAIIIRLGELQMEQLGRDTWDQVQQRRMFYPLAPSSMPHTTPLNAGSKEFVPSVTRSENLPGHIQLCPPDMAKPRVLDTVVEVQEGEEDNAHAIANNTKEETESRPETDTESEDLCNHGLEYTYQKSDNATEISQLRPSHVRERLSSCLEEKRMSLPTLSFVWPGA